MTNTDKSKANNTQAAQLAQPSKILTNLGNLALQRSWRKHWIYPLLFIVAMLLSLSTYLTLDSIQRSVDAYVADNQRALVGGDVIVTSRQDWSEEVKAAISKIADDKQVYDYQFTAMISNQAALLTNINSTDAANIRSTNSTNTNSINSTGSNSNTQTNNDITLLARIKAVSSAYPLYGEVGLASGKPLWTKLTPNSVVVEAQVLTGLNVKVGDSIKIGEAYFVISDELLAEPDRPLTAFGFGARVLMSTEAVQKTQLMGQRSRINYRIELAKPSDNADILDDNSNVSADDKTVNANTNSANGLVNWQNSIDTLNTLAENNPEITVEDSDNSDTAISRISDNVLAFLKLLVIAVLFLAAVANLSVINAFVELQRPSNAMRKALGEPIASIKGSYYRVFMLTTLVGFIGSVLLSLLMLHMGAQYLASVLPASLNVALNGLSVLKVGVVATIITLLMLQHSLHAVTHTKPSAVLKQNASQSHHPNKRPTKAWYVMALVFALLLMTYEFGSITLGLKMLGSMALLVGSFWLLAKFWLWLLAKSVKQTSRKKVWQSKWQSSRQAPRQSTIWINRTAVHNLARKGNQSALFFVTLALSVAVLSMITLVNHSLTSQFINAYPKNAPNLFLLDVQTQQQKQLNAMIRQKTDTPLTYYPVVRARISEADGIAAKDIDSGTSDDPTRVFNLSYANSLLETEFIQKSVMADQLYASIANANKPTDNSHTDNTDNTKNTDDANNSDSTQIVPMSILDTAADMLDVTLGDTVRFNIQGIELIGQITSIRERYERGPSPFFYFLFEPQVLADAPQIQFATTQVTPADIPQLQTDLAKTFPAITSIDGGSIAKRVQGFVAQMSQLVYVFTVLSILTGIMVLITSLLATSQDRLRDSASFRLLGMQTRDLYIMNCLEIGLLGSSAATFGMLGASLAAWVMITQWFDLRFAFPWLTFALGGLGLMILLFTIALSYVRFVIGRGIMARVREMV